MPRKVTPNPNDPQNILVVDPAGCGCVDCIVGESVPADELTEEQKELVATDPSVIDRTSYTNEEWDQFLL